MHESKKIYKIKIQKKKELITNKKIKKFLDQGLGITVILDKKIKFSKYKLKKKLSTRANMFPGKSDPL